MITFLANLLFKKSSCRSYQKFLKPRRWALLLPLRFMCWFFICPLYPKKKYIYLRLPQVMLVASNKKHKEVCTIAFEYIQILIGWHELDLLLLDISYHLTLCNMYWERRLYHPLKLLTSNMPARYLTVCKDFKDL